MLLRMNHTGHCRLTSMARKVCYSDGTPTKDAIAMLRDLREERNYKAKRLRDMNAFRKHLKGIPHRFGGCFDHQWVRNQCQSTDWPLPRLTRKDCVRVAVRLLRHSRRMFSYSWDLTGDIASYHRQDMYAYGIELLRLARILP